MVEDNKHWYAVRCVFRFDGAADQESSYEERITLWQAGDADEAIERAEADAQHYAAETAETPGEYLGLAQAYWLFDDPGDGAEVFSMFRESPLDPDAFLAAYFDDGIGDGPDDE
ncbi:MAG: hypothetical protein QOC60_888 [Frankiaceae bacterium]|jgi:hypothetical protein|nr:hypothetical protein [Frankiaceae bacterium]MDQ1714943.1 hypothetical protein [Frankiaceae bacterium]